MFKAKKRKGLLTVVLSMILMIAFVLSVSAGQEKPNPFKDVKESDWFFENVQYVYEHKLMEGIGDAKFDPKGEVTRAMMVTVLYNYEGKPQSSSYSTTPFSDVPAGKWYSTPVGWAAANKVVNGYPDGTFKPNTKLNREQMATILYNYAVYKKFDTTKYADLSKYKDAASIAKYAQQPMAWANANNMVRGISETKLSPKGNATRAEMAAVFERYREKFGPGDDPTPTPTPTKTPDPTPTPTPTKTPDPTPTPTPIVYTVTFDENGHGTAPEGQNVEEGGLVTKPEDLTEEECLFRGWFKDAECNEEWHFDTDVVNSTTTLYAGWVELCRVKFDVCGHSTSPDSLLVEPGSTVERPANDPTATCWMFWGWYKDPECKTPWDFANDKINSDTTIYSDWLGIVGGTIYYIDENAQGGNFHFYDSNFSEINWNEGNNAAKIEALKNAVYYKADSYYDMDAFYIIARDAEGNIIEREDGIWCADSHFGDAGSLIGNGKSNTWSQIRNNSGVIQWLVDKRIEYKDDTLFIGSHDEMIEATKTSYLNSNKNYWTSTQWTNIYMIGVKGGSTAIGQHGEYLRSFDEAASAVALRAIGAKPLSFKAVLKDVQNDDEEFVKCLSFYYDEINHSSDGIVFDNLVLNAKKPWDWGYDSVREDVYMVEVDQSVYNLMWIESTAYMFSDMKNVHEVYDTFWGEDFECIRYDRICNMDCMFRNFACEIKQEDYESRLLYVNLSDISSEFLKNVTSAENVFENCLPGLKDDKDFWPVYIPYDNNTATKFFYGNPEDPEYGTDAYDKYISPCEGEVFTPGATCMAAGTLITMADGSKKVIEEIKIGDEIRVFNHETGKMDTAPVYHIHYTPNANNVFALYFEDDIEIKLIGEHGFYDKQENKYVFINPDNAKDYIGHEFYNADDNSWVKLTKCEKESERVAAYAIITAKHLNAVSNEMLSMCDGSVKPIANIFEYDENMKIDPIKKAQDIEKYGTVSREEMPGCSADDYENYNMKYLPIAVGKGFTTWAKIEGRNALYAE